MSKSWDMARVASMRSLPAKPRQMKQYGVFGPSYVEPVLGQLGHSRARCRSTKDLGACSACGFHQCSHECLMEQSQRAEELRNMRESAAENARKRAYFDRVIAAYPSGFTVIHHPAQQKGRVWVDHECKVIVFNVQDMPDNEIEAATANAKRLAEESDYGTHH